MRHFNTLIISILLILTLFLAILNTVKDYVGVHYIIDVDNITSDILYNNKALTDICEDTLRLTNVTILNKTRHEFQPQGLTLLYLLAESHFTLHSWPEQGKLRIDYFSCQNHEKCKIGSQYLQSVFKDATVNVSVLYR